MISMLSAMPAILFQEEFFLILELILGCQIVPAAADGTNETQFDGGILFGHTSADYNLVE